MFRPAGDSDSERSDEDGFYYFAENLKASKTNNSDHNAQQQNCASEPTSVQLETNFEKTEVSPMTINDIRLAIDAGDVSSVLACLSVIDVNIELSVWGVGKTSLALLAASKIQPHVLSALVEKGGRCNGEGYIALAGAVNRNSNCEDVEQCANILLGVENESINCVQHQGLTPLMLASRAGCIELVIWFVEHGAKLDYQDHEGWTALMFSVDSGAGQVARYLLDIGANPLIVNNDGQRAADIAGGFGSSELQDIVESFCEIKGRLKDTRNKSVKNVTEMENILVTLELRELIPLFSDHRIGVEEFLMMSDTDFASLGIEKVGVIKRLLVGQAEMHKAEWSKTSLPSLNADYMREGLTLNMLTATGMMANISQHARYIKTSVSYIRAQLQDHGDRLLSAGGDIVTPKQFVQQVQSCELHINVLIKEIELLRKDLQKYPVTKQQERVDGVSDISRSYRFPWFLVVSGTVGCLGLAIVKKIL